MFKYDCLWCCNKFRIEITLILQSARGDVKIDRPLQMETNKVKLFMVPVNSKTGYFFNVLKF